MFHDCLRPHRGTLCFTAFLLSAATIAAALAQEREVPRRLAFVTKEAKATLQTGSTFSMAFSPDGKMLATGSGDQRDLVKIWDVATGQYLRALDGFEFTILRVVFSPDGKMLATAGAERQGQEFPGVVKIWDTATWQLLRKFNCPSSQMAFTPDSKKLATGTGSEKNGRAIILWDPATGQQLSFLKAKELNGMISALACSPDGKRLAAGTSHGFLHLWDLDAEKEIFCLRMNQQKPGESPAVSCVAFAPDGKTVATASSKPAVTLVDTASGKITATPQYFGSSADAVAFSPDGKTLAALRGILHLWDPATGKVLALIQTNPTLIPPLAISPVGKILATGSSERTVKLWDIEKLLEPIPPK
jgi:WD40 repeat protein